MKSADKEQVPHNCDKHTKKDNVQSWGGLGKHKIHTAHNQKASKGIRNYHTLTLKDTMHSGGI